MEKNRFKGLRALAIEKPNKSDHLPIEVSNELMDDCYLDNAQAEIFREMFRSYVSDYEKELLARVEAMANGSNRINPDGAPATPISKVLSGIQSLRDRVRDYWNW